MFLIFVLLLLLVILVNCQEDLGLFKDKRVFWVKQEGSVFLSLQFCRSLDMDMFTASSQEEYVEFAQFIDKKGSFGGFLAPVYKNGKSVRWWSSGGEFPLFVNADPGMNCLTLRPWQLTKSTCASNPSFYCIDRFPSECSRSSVTLSRPYIHLKDLLFCSSGNGGFN